MCIIHRDVRKRKKVHWDTVDEATTVNILDTVLSYVSFFYTYIYTYVYFYISGVK